MDSFLSKWGPAADYAPVDPLDETSVQMVVTLLGLDPALVKFVDGVGARFRLDFLRAVRATLAWAQEHETAHHNASAGDVNITVDQSRRVRVKNRGTLGDVTQN